MNRARRLALQHALAPTLDRAVDSLCVALSPDTTRHYRGTVRKFLVYLGAEHPEVNRLDQLRREPHSGLDVSPALASAPLTPPTSTTSLPCASFLTNWLARNSLWNWLA